MNLLPKSSGGKKKEKKLFTKFDILILLSVFAVFLSVFVGIKFIFQKDEYVTVELLASGGEWWWGTPPPYYWNATPVQKGDTEYDVLKRPLVEVLEVTKIVQDNRKILLVKARLKVRKNTRTNSYAFRQGKVEIGRTITLSPNNVSIIGQVVSIEGVGQLGSPKEILMTAKVYYADPWRVDMMQVGDYAKNSNGEIIAEITDKKVEPAVITTTNWLGQTLVGRDPLMQDVTLSLKMKVQKDGENYFHNYYQLLQKGLAFHVQLIGTQVDAVVMDIKEI